MQPSQHGEEWQLRCEGNAFSSALRRLVPSIRARRFHKRKAWPHVQGGLLIVEIDRGVVELPATGNWLETVAIICRDLYVLTKCVPPRKDSVLIGFRDEKLRISFPGLKWACPATLEAPPTSFISPIDSTYLRPSKKRTSTEGTSS